MFETIIKNLVEFKPRAVFVYGSHARGEAKPNSDVEIGVVFDDNKYVKKDNIDEKCKPKNVNIYPFKYSELVAAKPNVPFPQTIFVYELVHTAKVLWGEDVMKHIKAPNITVKDLKERIGFDNGVVLTCLKTGQQDMAIKSCIYAFKTLTQLEKGVWPLTYKETFEYMRAVKGYEELVKELYEARFHNARFRQYFKCLSFINYVRTRVDEEMIE